VRIVEDVPGLVPEIPHDLARILQVVGRALDLPKLRIGKIEGNAQHRLLIRATPLIGQIAAGTEFLETPSVEFTVQLPDKRLDW
jgi:hypothetical protein